jgi:hypothetical protein
LNNATRSQKTSGSATEFEIGRINVVVIYILLPADVSFKSLSCHSLTVSEGPLVPF